MMNKYILVIILSILLVSCSSIAADKRHEVIVREYFKNLNNSNFSKISAFLHDSVITLEGEFVISKNKPEVYTIFQWDSVFAPVYDIKNIHGVDQNIEVTLSKECDRIRFLHDSAIIYRSLFEFQGDQIITISTVENLVFDVQKWSSRRDTLVNWIDQNHPELSGFIYDQTIQGANDYLQAIELFPGENVP